MPLLFGAIKSLKPELGLNSSITGVGGGGVGWGNVGFIINYMGGGKNMGL